MSWSLVSAPCVPLLNWQVLEQPDGVKEGVCVALILVSASQLVEEPLDETGE